jgi:hypothetical protein
MCVQQDVGIEDKLMHAQWGDGSGGNLEDIGVSSSQGQVKNLLVPLIKWSLWLCLGYGFHYRQ